MKNKAKKPSVRPSATASLILGTGMRDGRPNGAINSQWKWHYRALIKAQERLLGDRGDARMDASEPMESHSMNMADSATDEYDHGTALSRLGAGQIALSEINEAIGRIHDGSYGICEVSGSPIAPERLKAIPWARYCKEVEESMESEGKTRRTKFGQLGPLSAP